MNDFLSVIMPVFNREETLLSVFEGILKQTLPYNFFEIIIINDASEKNIKNFLEKNIDLTKINIKFFRNSENMGSASSRNVGIKNSQGNIVLFLGGDIIPDKDLFKIHFDEHEKNKMENIAILGYVCWQKGIATPFMEWLDNGGPQNAYPKIEGKEYVDYNYFYGSNISLKKSFVLKNGLFEEKFKEYGWEDAELGYRLSKKGLKIRYIKDAIGFHSHKLSLTDVLKRMVVVGRSAVLFNNLHKELGITKPYFNFSKKIAREIIFTPPIIFILRKIGLFYENKKICPKLYTRLVSLYFFKGIKQGLQKYGE